MRKRLCAAIGFLILGLGLPVPTIARSAGEWVGRSTPHFAIYSSDPQKSGREILERLETARLFFEHTGWHAQDANSQLKVVAFGSGKDYEFYRLNPGAFAFYQRTREGDYVVMRDLDPEHYTVAVHEYTHYVVEHAGLKLPLWLNEGIADLYSTVECRQSQAMVGLAPSGRENTLTSRRWLDWATLTSVDYQSDYYRQPDKMMLFYSQSWVLVHMLATDAAYAGGFAKFLAAISAGATTDGALTSVYHQTLEQVGRDAEQYAGSKRMSPRLLNIDVRPGSLETADVADAVKPVEFALADVLAANPQMAQEAKSRLEVLTAKYPEDPRSEEALGFIAMRAGLQKDAEKHFARAVQTHSQNPEVLFRLAHLKMAAQGPNEEVVDLLQRALAVDGTNYNARLELGFAAAKGGKFELAVQALEKIGTVKAEHAYIVSYTLAYSLVEAHQGNRARLYAQQAQKIAGSNKDQEQVAGLLRYIEQESPMEVASR